MKRYIFVIALILFFTGMQHLAQAGHTLTVDVVPDFGTFSFVNVDGLGADPAPGDPFIVEGVIHKKNTTDVIGTYLCRGWFIVPQPDGDVTYVSQSYEINGKGTIFVQGNEDGAVPGTSGFRRAIVGGTYRFRQKIGQAHILPHPTLPPSTLAFRIFFRFFRVDDDDRLVTPPTEHSEALQQDSKQDVASVELEQNYPNPFNPETEISFTLPKTSMVVVKIYNSLGQEVRALADGQYETGTHTLRWDGLNNQGSAVASGVYLQRLEVDGISVVKKMNLVR